MSAYPAYAAYQQPTASWLEPVPSGWMTLAIGRLFRRLKRTGFPNAELLSVYRDHGVIPKSSRDDNFNKPSEDLNPYQLVRRGDLVMNKMKSWQGSIAMSEYEGIVSPAYFVYEPWQSATQKFFPKYLHHLVRSPLYITQYLSRSKGIRVNQWDLDPEAFERIEALLPPLSEQTQIARFLDYETARIDALIEKQQQLIALLKEKRQAVISHAVTKGLNPNAPLRDSGVEWLGMVPAHWEVHALRFCAKDGNKTFTDGDWIESPFITESGVRLLQTGNVGIGEFREKGFRYISEESFHRLSCTEIFPNDVLVCRLDGPVGRACLTPDLGVRMVTSVDNAILKASDAFDPRFVVYTMTSTEWISWIENICRAGGGFRFRISRSMLGSQRVPAPPIQEQRRIADFLDEGRSRHDMLINRAEEAVDLLQERRTALISAAVTGKIDVRGWQPPESKVEDAVA